MTNKIENKNEIEVVEKKEMNNLVEIRKYMDYVNSINDGIKNIVSRFLIIGKCLNKVKEEELYKLEGYSNIYEFSKDKFNFGETSTKNFINVFLRFTDSKEAKLKNEYEKYSFSQLVELLPVSEDGINNYDPKMSVQEIKQVKKESQLTDDLDKCSKEFKAMATKVKELLVKELFDGDSLVEAKINYEIGNCDYAATISLKQMTKTKEFYFKLKTYNHELEYWFNDVKYQMDSVFRAKNFLSFMNELKKNIKRYLSNLEKEKKQKEEQKEKKIREKELSMGATLRNDKDRMDFIQNMNNWTLVADVKELRMSIYKFNPNNDFIKFFFGDRCIEIKKLVFNSSFGDACYNVTTKDIVEYLKEIKY